MAQQDEDQTLKITRLQLCLRHVRAERHKLQIQLDDAAVELELLRQALRDLQSPQTHGKHDSENVA